MGKLLASSYRSSALVRSCAYRLGGQFLKYWPARKEELYHGYRSLYANNDVMTLLSPAIAAYYRAAHHTTDYARKIRTIFATEPDELNAFSKAELSWYIPGMLSRDTDAMTMAFTTEARVPFLDEELVHYVVGLPGNYKRGLRQRVNKPLLVDAFADVLPSWIINQPKKGFEMPVGSWLLQRFAPSLKRLQSCSWLNQERVRALQHGLIKNPADYQNVWSLLVLAAWKDYHGVTFASE